MRFVCGWLPVSYPGNAESAASPPAVLEFTNHRTMLTMCSKVLREWSAADCRSGFRAEGPNSLVRLENKLFFFHKTEFRPHLFIFFRFITTIAP